MASSFVYRERNSAANRRVMTLLAHATPTGRRRPLLTTVDSAGTPVHSDKSSIHWTRVQQREWRVGDRFKLIEDDHELERRFERVGVSVRGGEHAVANGQTGEILKVERGSPLAAVRFNAQQEHFGAQPIHTTIPLGAAMKLVPEECVIDERTADAALLQQMEARVYEEELPVMVLDATLPLQTLTVTFYQRYNVRVLEAAMDRPDRSFAMLGVHKRGSVYNLDGSQMSDLDWHSAPSGEHSGAPTPMYTGVEVQIKGDPVFDQAGGMKVHLKALRQFELSEGSKTWKEDRRGCLIARVDWCNDPDTGNDYGYGDHEPGAKHLHNTVAQLPRLVAEWCRFVVDGEHERFTDHLTGILDQIGPMPPHDRPGDMAMWVGALINPHPSLGVEQPISFDVRPSLLKAVTAAQRVHIAIAGIRASIELMDGLATKKASRL